LRLLEGLSRLLPSHRGFAWGFVDQSLSSVTNFGLSLLAGRLLGPKSLGVIAIGFAGYVLAVTLLRALVSEPLVIHSSRLSQRDRTEATRKALTVGLAGATAAAACLALFGLALPGSLGHGLILFSPLIVPALLQDFWRAVLFRDGRGAAAALNDGTWLVGMALGLPLALASDSEWAILAGWGLGASVGAVLGFYQARVWPARLPEAWRWWRNHEWPFARWLAGGGVIQAGGGQAVVLVLAAFLGPSAVGALRAAQAVFAPLTLLASAASLPGLPALSRALDESVVEARKLAARLSVVLLGLTLVYLLLAGAARDLLLGGLFGQSFARYDWLVFPVGAQQVVLAGGIGFMLLLKARLKGRVLAWNRAVGTLATVLFVVLGAWLGGLAGGAWALMAGTAVTSLFNVSFGLWPAWSRARLVPASLTRAGEPLGEA
jgi:O-antigen/teichoic acid export membrane protein